MEVLVHPLSSPTEPLAQKSIIAGLWNLLFAGPIKFTLFPIPILLVAQGVGDQF